MQLSRRSILKGVAGTATVGGLGALTLTGGATATAGGSIDNPNAVTSDDGKITYVAVQTTGRVEWDGFDRPAKKARIVVSVALHNDGQKRFDGVIHDSGKFELSQSWGGNGEAVSLSGDHSAGQSGYIASDTDWGICQQNRTNVYNNGYNLPTNPAPVSPMYANADGSTQETRVVLTAEYRLYADNGAELTGKSGYPKRPTNSSEFVVTVNNESASTNWGDNDGEGDTQDGATVGV